MILINNIVEKLFKSKPSWDKVKFKNNHDNYISMQEFINMITDFASISQHKNKLVHAYGLHQYYTQLNSFEPCIGAPFSSTMEAANKVFYALESLGLAEVNENAQAKIRTKQILIFNYSLNEAAMKRQDVAKLNPINIAKFVLQLPDDAIKEIIDDLTLRINSNYSSAYNNTKHSMNDKRISNHWNINANNRIDGVELDGNTQTAWLYGEWDDLKKKYKYLKSFSTQIPNRTKVEKCKIIDMLINDIFFDNSIAVSLLKDFKKSLKSD